MLYVGVDARKAHSQMTVMDETGTVLERRRAQSTRYEFPSASPSSNSMEPTRPAGG